MLLNVLFLYLLAILDLGAAQGSTNSSQQFVVTRNGQFFLGDQPFRYIGTSAYWLQLIDNDEDMNKTLSEIASRGIKVVRTWAFNDVTEIPSSGPWIRIFYPNGTIEVNTGENGLGRLDRIVRIAHQLGIYVLFSLTNNWAPRSVNSTSIVQPDGTVLNGNDLPRNYLSNDYGGMDTYVRHFAPNTTTDLAHDTFYVSNSIRNSFNDYIQTIVTRYKNEPSVIAWEAANDPRCNSTLPASTVCDTQTITTWTANTTTVIKQNDPNHLVASGDSGFYCVDCTKVFPFVPPSTSPVPGVRKREGPLTAAKILAKDAEWKKRNLVPLPKRKTGLSIRGKWSAPPEAGTHKRQTNSFGPLYDGTFGVDTEDLTNVPGIDFSSFQYFPDQNTYAPLLTSSTSNFSDIIQSGVDWINQHAQTANTYGRPSTLNGFGLVTNATQNTFAPFNSSVVVPQSGVATTQEQQVSAYNSWINAAIDSGVQGIIQYQWGTTNLTTNSSSPALTHQSGVGQASGSAASGFDTPNDGYAAYSDAVKGALQAGAARLASITGQTARKMARAWEF